MKYPPVVVVDENDNEVGSAMLAEVWQKGLYHRVVCVFVLDDGGRMLLQLRAPHMGIYPSCWDQAAAGHVDEGYTYDQSIREETAEELGLHPEAFTTLGTFRLNTRLDDGRIINQFNRTYSVQIPHDTALQPAPDEVAELRWFTPTELKALIAQHPEQITPGLLRALREYFPDFILV